jgi:hypothetical protein
MDEIKFYRYSIPSEGRYGGWGTFILDSTGFFAAITDFGNYAYRWDAFGKRDFREFVIQLQHSWDYVLGKVRPNGKEYDDEKTLHGIKRHILEYRRDGGYDKEFARREWNLLSENEDLNTEFNFYDWYQSTKIEEAYEFCEKSYDCDALAFSQMLMPRLAEAIKLDLQSEQVEVSA